MPVASTGNLAPDRTKVEELLDSIDGILDDTHPEGDGCPMCNAMDELRAALGLEP